MCEDYPDHMGYGALATGWGPTLDVGLGALPSLGHPARQLQHDARLTAPLLRGQLGGVASVSHVQLVHHLGSLPMTRQWGAGAGQSGFWVS